MDSKSVPILSALRTRMEWLSERQKLLSENIANADTPGYQARDLKPIDFQKLLKDQKAAGLSLTHPMHIKGGNSSQNFKFTPENSDISETNPSGNTVSIEEQMVKLGETQMEYETATGIYRKQSQMLKVALGNRN